MTRRTAIGPAAYHARLEQEKIAALEARVKELEARLLEWISPFQQSAKIKEAVQVTYAAAHKDGYRAGWADKDCGMVCHQYPYPPRGEPVMMMTAADR
jgi:hypothetical protein